MERELGWKVLMVHIKKKGHTAKEAYSLQTTVFYREMTSYRGGQKYCMLKGISPKRLVCHSAKLSAWFLV